ncbi:MAG: hypothetical protein E6G94_10630 [Alphaproteobacteria bacterium]|nr:MAG: hypothetical protein E6G94_10630 [Alphaproteobacteria bacterium]
MWSPPSRPPPCSAIRAGAASWVSSSRFCWGRSAWPSQSSSAPPPARPSSPTKRSEASAVRIRSPAPPT